MGVQKNGQHNLKKIMKKLEKMCCTFASWLSYIMGDENGHASATLPWPLHTRFRVREQYFSGV